MRRSCRSRIACTACDIGYIVGSTGCNFPAAICVSTSRSISAFSAWCRPTQAPQSTPTTVLFCNNTKLAGRRGIPATNPTTRYCPPAASARNDGSARSPPTGSYTMSRPPSASSRARVLTSSVSTSIVANAPRCSAKARFSSLDAAAMTRMPIDTPTSTAANPTPPPAPRTSIVIPSRTTARLVKANHAVR